MQAISKYSTKQLCLFPNLDRKHVFYLIKEKLKEDFKKSLKIWFKILLRFPGILAWILILISQFSITNLMEIISVLGTAYHKAEVTQQIAFIDGVKLIGFYAMLFVFVVIFTSIFISSAFNSVLSPKEKISTVSVLDFSAEKKEINTKHKNQR
ncbi:hypothetical protein ACFL0U_01960 [Pseudomonadota bacterium]